MKTTEESITPADAQDIQRYRDELKPGEGLQFPSTRVCDLDCGDPSLRDRPPLGRTSTKAAIPQPLNQKDPVETIDTLERAIGSIDKEMKGDASMMQLDTVHRSRRWGRHTRIAAVHSSLRYEDYFAALLGCSAGLSKGKSSTLFFDMTSGDDECNEFEDDWFPNDSAAVATDQSFGLTSEIHAVGDEFQAFPNPSVHDAVTYQGLDSTDPRWRSAGQRVLDCPKVRLINKFGGKRDLRPQSAPKYKPLYSIAGECQTSSLNGLAEVPLISAEEASCEGSFSGDDGEELHSLKADVDRVGIPAGTPLHKRRDTADITPEKLPMSTNAFQAHDEASPAEKDVCHVAALLESIKCKCLTPHLGDLGVDDYDSRRSICRCELCETRFAIDIPDNLGLGATQVCVNAYVDKGVIDFVAEVATLLWIPEEKIVLVCAGRPMTFGTLAEYDLHRGCRLYMREEEAPCSADGGVDADFLVPSAPFVPTDDEFDDYG